MLASILRASISKGQLRVANRKAAAGVQGCGQKAEERGSKAARELEGYAESPSAQG